MSENDSLPIVKSKTDVDHLRVLLGIVKEYKEELEWLLQRQSQLRTEFITFHKKDRAEITLQLKNQLESSDEIELIIKNISNLFRSDLERSLAVVDARYQKISKSEV